MPASFSCLLASPRAKIQACIAKGGVPDDDCPTDMASMRFWCTTTKKQTSVDRTQVHTSASANVHASAAFNALDGGFAVGTGPLVPVQDTQALLNAAAAATPKMPATPAAPGTLFDQTAVLPGIDIVCSLYLLVNLSWNIWFWQAVRRRLRLSLRLLLPKPKAPLEWILLGKRGSRSRPLCVGSPVFVFNFFFIFFLLFTPVWQGSELKKEINAINGMLLDLGDEERVKDGVSELKTLMANVVSLHGRPALSFELFLPFCY